MARRTEVLLVKDVLKLGNMGDIVRVAPGYARNYLFPYGLAVLADQATKRQIEVLREKAARHESEREAQARALAARLEGATVQIAQRVSHDDELFGSVGTREIVQALAKLGVQVDSKQVHLHDRIRRLGRYPVEVSLHKSVAVTVTVEVVNSDPNAPSLAETLAMVAAKREQERAAREAAKKAEKATAEAAPAEAAAAAKADGKAGKKESPEKAKQDKGAGAQDKAAANASASPKTGKPSADKLAAASASEKAGKASAASPAPAGKDKQKR